MLYLARLFALEVNVWVCCFDDVSCVCVCVCLFVVSCPSCKGRLTGYTTLHIYFDFERLLFVYVHPGPTPVNRCVPSLPCRHCTRKAFWVSHKHAVLIRPSFTSPPMYGIIWITVTEHWMGQHTLHTHTHMVVEWVALGGGWSYSHYYGRLLLLELTVKPLMLCYRRQNIDVCQYSSFMFFV